MGRKNTHNWKPFDSADISTNQTSTITDTQQTDNIGFFVDWSGTSPVGSLQVQVSNDKLDVPLNWEALDFGSPITISGNTGSHVININMVPFAKIRLVYTSTSGTGLMTVNAQMKQIGG